MDEYILLYAYYAAENITRHHEKQNISVVHSVIFHSESEYASYARAATCTVQVVIILGMD